MTSAITPVILVTAFVSSGCGFVGPTVRPPKEVCVREFSATQGIAGSPEHRRYELQVPYHVSGRNPHDNFRRVEADQNYWLYLDARQGRVDATNLILTKVRGQPRMNEAVTGYVELGETLVTFRLDAREHYWDLAAPALPWRFNGTFALRAGEQCTSMPRP